METVFHRDVAAGDVSDHLGDEEGVVFGTLFLMAGIVAGFFFERVKTADTGSYDYAYTVRVDGAVGGIESSILDSLTGSNERILGVEVELTLLAAVEVVRSLEVLDFTCKLCLEFRSIEVGDRTRA